MKREHFKFGGDPMRSKAASLRAAFIELEWSADVETDLVIRAATMTDPEECFELSCGPELVAEAMVWAYESKELFRAYVDDVLAGRWHCYKAMAEALRESEKVCACVDDWTQEYYEQGGYEHVIDP